MFTHHFNLGPLFARLAVGVTLLAPVAPLFAPGTPLFAQSAGREVNVTEQALPGQGRSAMNPDGRSAYVPPELSEVGVDEKPGTIVPLDLEFTDEDGKTVRLRDLIVPDRPIVLQLSYFECPMLCDLVSKGMVKALNELKLEIGKDFTVLNVSFNPNDKPLAAALKKDAYLNAYDRPELGGSSWHFLVGSQTSINTLTTATGFKYKWIPDASQFSHPAILFVLTADGMISNYVYGAQPSAKVLKNALVGAGKGEVGSIFDRFIQACFHVSGDGKYTPNAFLLMRTAGVLTVLGIAATIGLLLMKEMNARRVTGVVGGLRTTGTTSGGRKSEKV